MTEGLRTDERPSAGLVRVVLDRFGVDIAGATEGWEGEESIGWRGSSPEGDRFVQRLPPWRDVHQIAWCDAVARTASTRAPECVHAVPSLDGTTVVVTPDGPVVVFPFVEGTHDPYPEIQGDAAALLARIHRGIASAWTTGGPRPLRRRPALRARPDLLVDHDLDTWERVASSAAVLPIHGDYYAGNLLTSGDRIVGVVDWGDARIAPFEREVAWAVWEFCQDDDATDLVADGAEAFLRRYVEAGGPAQVARPFDPCLWIRVRLRDEARAWFGDPRSETETNGYYEAQLVAFERLRGRHLPGR